MIKKVKEMIRIVEADGWRFERQKGSHRHFRHPTKPGTVTIAGKESDTLPHKTVRSIMEQAGL